MVLFVFGIQHISGGRVLSGPAVMIAIVPAIDKGNTIRNEWISA
jgi:hypothetical protein